MPGSASLAVALLCACSPGSAFAALRSPQVAVQGSSLQSYFNSVGESIDVLHDQWSLQVLIATVSNNSGLVVEIEATLKDPELELGLYDGAAPAPELVPMLPSGSGPGSYAIAAFRVNPTRLSVSWFDRNAVFQGAKTYPGGNRFAIAFYEKSPDGTLYTEDSRNPGATPQALAYRGTGIYSGCWWFAFERTPLGAGSDQDFDDAVIFVEGNSIVPVQRTSWGEVKKRFR